MVARFQVVPREGRRAKIRKSFDFGQGRATGFESSSEGCRCVTGSVVCTVPKFVRGWDKSYAIDDWNDSA